MRRAHHSRRTPTIPQWLLGGLVMAFVALGICSCGRDERGLDKRAMEGSWRATPESLARLARSRHRELFSQARPMLELRDGGDFTATDYPVVDARGQDWLRSGTGHWELRIGTGNARLVLDFDQGGETNQGFGDSVGIVRQGDDYLIGVYLGDPDLFDRLDFRREEEPLPGEVPGAPLADL
jgi:hypothetical protein